MITRTVKVQLIAFATITAVGVSYVGAEYTGLVDEVLDRGYTVRADFPDSGGVFPGAEVTYRGVPVGKVGGLHLTGEDGVSIALDIEDEASRIPADTLAVVANRSAVGEQYVDLQPRTSHGPYLLDGSDIPRRNTRVPLPTTDLVLSLDRLVNSVGKKDLRVTVDELGEAFAGTGPNLSRLVDSGNDLVESASDALPETIALIEDSRKVLKTQADQGSSIKSFAHDLAALSAQLKASDGDLRKLIGNARPAAQEVNSLLKSVTPELSVLLANLISGGQVTLARLPGVEQALVTFPVMVAGSYTVIPGDGTTHFGLVLNADDPPACTQGYGTARRDPADTSTREANTGAHCTLPRGSESSVRGAQNAPGASAAPDGANQAAYASPYVTPYDPETGTTTGPDGRTVEIGSTGGQRAVFGKESWQWLLVGPMA
ncbi:ABC transporter substrate-binding protein [Streptomyces viridochromogenes]|uniref:ABC transporter substrate-binding protein n=1 Tax=Streptomyces viridochromogenes TaxID=1938 RepID=A0A0J7Z647_STRVR|nr:MlaD family protein [Streptomyces viridochromogenes]KMS70952.1 ABC transporter substrate-binding protein [Streptomyces viridochromogenes]KOG07110.1 ABC transporter substrate-binding protein [Streptomyces viridochromogenes]KOG07204.1 ABC transporter substrate-binding protein [Streptomyces viridochromogenes]